MKSVSKNISKIHIPGSRISACLRSGQVPAQYCSNFIQSVFRIGSDRIICGSDSALRSCFHQMAPNSPKTEKNFQLETPFRRFSLDSSLVPFTPEFHSVAEKIGSDQIISAGAVSLDKSTHTISLSKFTNGRFSTLSSTDRSLFSRNTKFLDIKVFDKNAWILTDEAKHGNLVQLCGDQNFDSLKKYPLSCCHKNHCRRKG